MTITTQIARKHTIADGLELAAQTCLQRSRDPNMTKEAKAREFRMFKTYQHEAERVRAE